MKRTTAILQKNKMRRTIACLMITLMVTSILHTTVFAGSTNQLYENKSTCLITEEDIKAYCDAYSIEYRNTTEFRNEVKEMISERGIITRTEVVKYQMSDKLNTSSSSSSGDKGKKTRNIPESSIGDIIWTNNPATPWNHVGLYRKTDNIIEALGSGVKTRNTGKQQEYPFEVYKVMKADNSGRYALSNRKAVASWAYKQLNKKYDLCFDDNKENTTESNRLFNCSELVWKAWRYNGKVSPDLDSNGGLGVYPNNIKNSSRTVKIKEG